MLTIFLLILLISLILLMALVIIWGISGLIEAGQKRQLLNLQFENYWLNQPQAGGLDYSGGDGDLDGVVIKDGKISNG